MEFCPHCGIEIKEPVTYCPRCGELLERDLAERSARAVALIVGMILQYMPLSKYYSFIPNIYFSVVNIDLFLSYRKMKR
jgi:uncharacterized paraquat-inducible protein A